MTFVIETRTVFKTNYNNMYSCNIPPLEALRQTVESAVGTLPSKLLYMFLVLVADILFVMMSYGIYRLCAKVLSKKKSAEKELVH